MPISVYEFQQLRREVRELQVLTKAFQMQLEKSASKTDKEIPELKGQRLNTKTTTSRKK